MSDIERTQFISTQLHILANNPDCDAHFAAGLRMFATSLKPSHSLTSRTPSLCTLIKKHLDEPLLDVLTSYSGIWDCSLLEGQALSKMLYGSNSDAAISDSHEMPADRYIHNIRIWDQKFRKAIHSVTTSAQPTRVPETIDEWEFFSETEHSDSPSQEEEAEISESSRFICTLDRVRATLNYLTYLRPKSGTIPVKQRQHHELNGIEVPHSPLLDSRTRPHGENYCELCWRLTMRSDALKAQRNVDSPASQARKLSDRYCHIHNPSDPTSKYRRDLPYKKIFRDELLAFHHRALRSKFTLPPIAPMSPDDQEIRKAVYEMIRTGTYAVYSKTDSPPLMQRILAVRRKGITQSEIARQLGISKQAVSAQMKKIRTYLEKRSKEIYDPSSMEWSDD
jgi:hypothetical protein